MRHRIGCIFIETINSIFVEKRSIVKAAKSKTKQRRSVHNKNISALFLQVYEKELLQKL